jgi:hypothetical protein
LQVDFDEKAVTRLLIDAGLPLWGKERPLTLICLKLEDAGSTMWISRDSSTPERQSVEAAAANRGLPLVWPVMSGEEQSLLDSPVGSSQLLQLVRRYGADAILIGRAVRTTADVSGRWSLQAESTTVDVTGGLSAGIDATADMFAKLYAVSGSALSEVVVEISGVQTLKAYAEMLNSLESLTVVRTVAVERVAGDTVRFRLAVRGDSQTLRRALALNRRLASDTAAGTADDHLSFRYQP